MNSLRRNKLWLMLVLVLAMVSTIGGMPAVAAACGDRYGAKTVPDAVAVEVCPVMGTAGHCCCGPSAGAAAAGGAKHTAAGELSQRTCDCTLQAPVMPPPADRKASSLVSPVQAAILPSALVSLRLPESTPSRHATYSSGPPRAPYRVSAPSRAPPLAR